MLVLEGPLTAGEGAFGVRPVTRRGYSEARFVTHGYPWTKNVHVISL